MTRPTRRPLFGGAAASAVAPAIPVPASAAADAALIYWCWAFLAETRERERLNTVGAAMPDPATDEEERAYEAVLDACLDRQDLAVAQVLKLPATTRAGLKAKAEVLRVITLQDAIASMDHTIEDAQDHERLAYAMAEDVLQGAWA